MIVARTDLASLENKTTTRPQGGYDVTGYGRRIPTTHMVRLPGSPRWRRVYCCCYSNSGTCYVEIANGTNKPDWHVID